MFAWATASRRRDGARSRREAEPMSSEEVQRVVDRYLAWLIGFFLIG